jgi:AcrR family transcriptional regulator
MTTEEYDDDDDEGLPDSHEEIMAATHTAICQHGYADLTMRKIAAESSKSHSLLTYHYDTKANLVHAYLEYLVSVLESDFETDPDAHPVDRIEAYLDYFTVGTELFPEPLQIAFLELQVAAFRDEALRTRLAEHNRENVRLLSEIVADGVERGVFRQDVDPDRVAKLLLAAVVGASEQQTVGVADSFAPAVRESLRQTVFPRLQATDSSRDEE